MPLPSSISYVGLGLEATKGTGVVPTAFIPVDPNSLKPADAINYMDDLGLRGSMAVIYDQIPGTVYSTIELAGPVYPDTFGFLLAGLLGDVVTTGAGAPFSHVMSLKNSGDGQPKSLSVSDFYGLGGGTPDRRYPGVQVNEIQFKSTADGFIQHTTKCTGLPSVLVAKPTASFTTVQAVPTWKGTLTIAGAGKTYLTDSTMTLKRNVTPIAGFTGTQAVYAIWVAGLEIDGTFTFIHEDDTELVRYLTNSQPAMVFDWQQGAGAGLVEVKFQMTKVAYMKAGLDRGADFVKLVVSYKATANTTDVGATGGWSPIKATLQSALPSGTYQ